MHILMVHPHDIYSSLEPWTVRITYLAEQFVKMGHKVRLVYHLENPHQRPDIMKHRQEFSFQTIPMIRFSSTLLYKTKKMIELAQWADVIHFQKAFAYCSIPSIIAGVATGTPVHYDWDDWEAEIFKNSCPDDDYWYKYTHHVERLIPKLVDTVSVASLSLWQQATALGVDHTLVFQAPVGGDPDHFNPDDLDVEEIKSQYDFKDNIVTYMGQLHGAQYCSLFLEAAAKLREMRDDITFLVIGNGSQFLDLMKQAEDLGLNDSIIFTGSVPHDVIPKFLKVSDVCVAAFEDTPQVRTKSPLKICEYMAAGKAIVASDVGEVSNMLDNGNAGVLVPAGDPLPLAAGIQKVLSDPSLRKHLEYNARQRSLNTYNWTKTAESLMNAYHLGMGKKKKIARRFKFLKWERLYRLLFQSNSKFDCEDLPQGKMISTLDDFKRMAGVQSVTNSFIGPQLVQLDVTNLCNNDCVACWSNSPMLEDLMIDTASKKDTIPLDVCKRILDEMHSIGTKEIYMAGGGDPTMHPEHFEIWEKIKDLGMVLYVNTNFVRLCSTEKIKRTISMGLDHFTISMWAGSAEAYSKTHPNKGPKDFDKVKKGLTLLNSLKESTPYVKVYHVISRLNYDDFWNMLDFCVETGSESVEFTLVDTIPGKTDQLLLTEEERQWLYEQCEKVAADCYDQKYKNKVLLFGFERFMRRLSSVDSNVGDHDKNIVESFPCYIGHLFARIMPDGDVNTCLKSHRMPTGNIYEDGFDTIWSSSRQKYFRLKAQVYEKQDPMFALIGNNAEVDCGCHKSCDDISRNQYMHKRVSELNFLEKGFLNVYQGYLESTGQKL